MFSRVVFPSLLPRIADPLWFNVDKPCDDENELNKLEEEHQDWQRAIAEKDSDVVPIGKSAAEHLGDEDEDEEDDDADVEDETDTNDDDDELGTDMIDDRDSPDDPDIDASEVTNESPAWGM